MSLYSSNSKFGTVAGEDPDTLASSAFNMVSHLRAQGELPSDPELGKVIASVESFSPAEETAAVRMMGNLKASVESFFRSADANGISISNQQAEAVTFALASAMNPRAHITRAGAKNARYDTNAMSVFVPDHSGIDPSKLPAATLEAYDTKPNDETLQFTASFALATATQNKFGELFYKTVNLSPDQYAVQMEIPLIMVHDEVKYELEKRLTDFNRKNIINAEIDHTILKNDTLKIIPVWRDQTKDMFVDQALVPPTATMNEDGESIMTAPLRIGYRSSLFRAAQTDAQIAKGVMDQTDALDVGAVMTAVYLSFSNDDGSVNEVVRIDTSNLPLNQFSETIQGATRLMQLNFTTDAVAIGKATKLVDGGTSTLLTAFQGDPSHTGWLSFSVRGDINLQDSSYELIAGTVHVNTLKNPTGLPMDPEDPANAALVKVLKTAKVIGFDLDARKVNSNLRELGQLADFNTYRQIYGISLGSPLSVQRPIMNGETHDALHAAALSYLCKVRQSNKAVTTLLNEVESLRAYQKRTDIVGRQPEIMGISSYLIEPVLIEEEIDLDKEVTTTAQHERYKDITSILTDTITIVAYKLWQMSNWQAAANLLEGTEAQPPVVKLGTDMVLTQYLKIDGDTRTVGPDFTYEKGWSPDARVRDKIFITLGYPTNQPGVPHPLDHGMMLNKPEVVAALNLSRSSHSRELIVHPSFRHIPLCPILAVITVKNLQKALTKKATLQVSNP